MEIKTATSDWWGRTRAFLKDVRVEMTKVTWPTWEELKGQTIVVIVAVLLIAAFIGSVDLVLSNLIEMLVRTLSWSAGRGKARAACRAVPIRPEGLEGDDPRIDARIRRGRSRHGASVRCSRRRHVEGRRGIAPRRQIQVVRGAHVLRAREQGQAEHREGGGAPGAESPVLTRCSFRWKKSPR